MSRVTGPIANRMVATQIDWTTNPREKLAELLRKFGSADTAATAVTEVETELKKSPLDPGKQKKLDALKNIATQMDAEVVQFRNSCADLNKQYDTRIAQCQKAAAANLNRKKELDEEVVVLRAAQAKIPTTIDNNPVNSTYGSQNQKDYNEAKERLAESEEKLPVQKPFLETFIAEQMTTGTATTAPRHHLDTAGLDRAIAFLSKPNTPPTPQIQELQRLKTNVEELNKKLDDVEAAETKMQAANVTDSNYPDLVKDYRNALKAVDDTKIKMEHQLQDESSRTLVDSAMKAASEEAELFALAHNVRMLDELMRHEIGAHPDKDHKPAPQMGYGKSALDATQLEEEVTGFYTEKKGKHWWKPSLLDWDKEPLPGGSDGKPIKLNNETLLKLIAEYNKEQHDKWIAGGRVGPKPEDITYTLKNGKIKTIHCHDEARRNDFIKTKMVPANEERIKKAATAGTHAVGYASPTTTATAGSGAAVAPPTPAVATGTPAPTPTPPVAAGTATPTPAATTPSNTGPGIS